MSEAGDKPLIVAWDLRDVPPREGEEQPKGTPQPHIFRPATGAITKASTGAHQVRNFSYLWMDALGCTARIKRIIGSHIAADAYSLSNL